MIIIVRSCGERTTRECARRAAEHGMPEIITAQPFGETMRQTYRRGIEIAGSQRWLPVIDADVLLFGDTIAQAVAELDKLDRQGHNVFCLDGKTVDKIMLRTRRAGVHIYRTAMLTTAMQYIDDDQLKPESHVRNCMAQYHAAPTHSGEIVFGTHDHEQYYADLWRKAVCQTQKLAGMIRTQPHEWARLATKDADYRVILAAHEYGKAHPELTIKIDRACDYGAAAHIAAMGLTEKGAM